MSGNQSGAVITGAEPERQLWPNNIWPGHQGKTASPVELGPAAAQKTVVRPGRVAPKHFAVESLANRRILLQHRTPSSVHPGDLWFLPTQLRISRKNAQSTCMLHQYSERLRRSPPSRRGVGVRTTAFAVIRVKARSRRAKNRRNPHSAACSSGCRFGIRRYFDEQQLHVGRR